MTKRCCVPETTSQYVVKTNCTLCTLTVKLYIDTFVQVDDPDE